MSVEDEGGGVVAEPAASQGTGHMTPSSMRCPTSRTQASDSG
eukprot:CAMPEP_0115721120 /NCGR_PEP_ID=MMETSP0272-20121206/78915_1 /TAXON_ID=71861 /ORGANISM="Scrippsiella trochoidea, Strain CCMP3099" /LENGTH=41 /DNA_ID= /DNA_START= /DNA_END= /DNA_ORIENTATION=